MRKQLETQIRLYTYADHIMDYGKDGWWEYRLGNAKYCLTAEPAYNENVTYGLCVTDTNNCVIRKWEDDFEPMTGTLTLQQGYAKFLELLWHIDTL